MTSSARVLTTASLAIAVACGTRTGLLAGSAPGDGGVSDAADSSATSEGGPTDAGLGETGREDGAPDRGVPCVGTIPFAEAGAPIRCMGEHEVLTCWGDTQYCHVTGGGPPPGFSSSECLPLPCGCEGRTGCGCVDASREQACFCHEEDGGVIVACAAP
jgi:hypothetical protein